MTTTQEMRPLQCAALDDPASISHAAALYGQSAVQSELALRQRGRVIDLRGDDEPPADPWVALQRDAAMAGRIFDAVVAAGLRCSTTILGDPFERQLRAREQVKATETQRDRWVVALGSAVTLRNGDVVREGSPITEKMIDHPHAVEVLQSLAQRGVVSEVPADVAWLRSQPESAGPYIATRSFETSDGKRFVRGQGCDASDFPKLERPRTFDDDTPLAKLTVKDLRQLVAREVGRHVPTSGSTPPPMSEFATAMSRGDVVLAVNWRPTTTASKSRGGK